MPNYHSQKRQFDVECFSYSGRIYYDFATLDFATVFSKTLILPQGDIDLDTGDIVLEYCKYKYFMYLTPSLLVVGR